MDRTKEEVGNSQPLFSIGMTTFNRKDLLKDTLLTILKQDFHDFEVIVGNDYLAEPLTLEMLGIEDQRIRIINNIKNLGELENMNSLLREARGKYFTWQFDDDPCSPILLSEVNKAIKQFDFPQCVFTSFTYIYGASGYDFKNHRNNSYLYSGKDFLRKYLSGSLRALGLWGFYNTEYLKQLGGAPRLSNGRMALYAEYLLLVKVGELSHIAYINSPLVSFRIHNNSWSCANVESELFMQAGINLVKESIKIFTKPELKTDFQNNLSSILKSVICAVVVKDIVQNKKLNKEGIAEYISQINNELNLLKDLSLYEEGSASLKIAVKGIPLYVFKAKLKVITPLRFLNLAHSLRSVISHYTNKSF